MSEQASENKSEKKGVSGKLLVVVFIAVDLLVMAGGAYFVYTGTVGYVPPQAREEVEIESLIRERQSRASESVMYTMDKFTVNLSGPPKRTIRIELNLEMLNEKGFEEIVTIGPSARDAVVQLLNEKKFAEIESIQGKLFLKDQIAMTLNQFLKEGVVKDVYFTEFLVQ